MTFHVHSGANINFVAMPFSRAATSSATFTPAISNALNWYVEYVPLNKTLAIPELYTYMLAQRLTARNGSATKDGPSGSG